MSGRAHCPTITRMISDTRTQQPSKLLQNLNPEQLAAVTLPASTGADSRGCRFGQDACADDPHRVAHPDRPALARRRDGGDLHQQGREGNDRRGSARCCRFRFAACGSARSMGCAIASCVRTGSSPRCRRAFRSSIRADQLSAVKRVIKSMSLDEERYVPKQVTWFIAGAEGGWTAGRSDVEVKRRAVARDGAGVPGRTRSNASAKAWSTSPS